MPIGLRNINWFLFDLDDLDQEMAVARLSAESRGEDHEAAALAARDRWCKAERLRLGAEIAASDHYRKAPPRSRRGEARSADLAWLTEANKVVKLDLGRGVTRSKADLTHRDTLIFVGYLAGMTNRQVEEAMGPVGKSTVSKVIDKMRAKTGFSRLRDKNMAIRLGLAKPKVRRVWVGGKRIRLHNGDG